MPGAKSLIVAVFCAAAISGASAQTAPTSAGPESLKPANSIPVFAAPLNGRSIPPPASTAPAVAQPPAKTETVTLPAGTHVGVVLDTPMSTRISKTGQVVQFKLASPYVVEGHQALDTTTVFGGHVTDVHKPGAFGRNGALTVKVDSVALTSGSQSLSADLQAADPNATFKAHSDTSKAMSTMTTITTIAEGTLIGASIGGGRGAMIGGGAGAGAILIMGMAKHGRDVYLEPGTPFDVVLKSPLTVTATEVSPAAPAEPTPGAHNNTQVSGSYRGEDPVSSEQRAKPAESANSSEETSSAPAPSQPPRPPR